ncbi:hypothetical protein [Paenibacillus melissococcoides]|nr:hypothetical protein [Paenibacillus melissococcoides]
MNEDKRRVAEVEEDVFNWKRRAEELSGSWLVLLKRYSAAITTR